MVILQVLDFKEFEEFERKASKIMTDYDGKIAFAFETMRNDDSSGEEVHIVEFQREEDFIRYKNDPRLQEFSSLRAKAISSTEVKIVTHEKSYS